MDKNEILKRVTQKIEFFIVACMDNPSTESELEQMMGDYRPDFPIRPSDGKYGVHSLVYGGYAGKKPGSQTLFEIIETGPIRYQLTQEGINRCKLIWDNIEFGKKSEEIEETSDTADDGEVVKTNFTYVFASKCEALFKGWHKIGCSFSVPIRIKGIMASTKLTDTDQVYKLFNPYPVLIIESNGYGLEIEKYLQHALFRYNLGKKQGAGRSTEFYFIDIETIKMCLDFFQKLYPDIKITTTEV